MDFEDPGWSARLLMAVRASETAAVDQAIAQLAAIDPAVLETDLPTDAERLATWLNVYNAAAQRLAAARPDAYGQRIRFFRLPAITIAGSRLSLDGIEHGLLRRSRWKAGLGWLGNPLPGQFERRFRVHRVDPRIHFALNCAAASCPPIAAYDAERIHAQLDLATRGYLAATVRRDGDRLTVPRVFLWFLGDFGGPRGVRRFLTQHGVDAVAVRLRFARFDWTPNLGPEAWRAPAEGSRARAEADEGPSVDGDTVRGSSP